MIVKNKKEREERHWIPFLLISFISLIAIYNINNNKIIRIKTIIPFGHNGFLFLFDIKLYFIIIVLLFNYGNIYQVFILFYSLAIPKVIYSTYLLFFGIDTLNNELNLFFHYFLFFLFFLILAKFMFSHNNSDNNNISHKGICLYIFIILFLLFCLTNTLAVLNSNIIYLDKIISGFLLAFSCYYFIFHVVNINQNDSLQLFHFIDNMNNNIIIVSLFIIIIFSIYLKNENKYYKYLSYLLYIISIIVPVYGILYELKFLFNSNRKNWSNFNFEKINENENDNINSLISDITITKSIKWNKTSFFIDIIRLVALAFIHIGIFYILDDDFIFSDDDIEEKNNSFLFFSFSIFTFIINKILLYWMKLINMTYFYLERNSINSR